MSRIREIHLSEFGSEAGVVAEAPTVATLLGAVGTNNDGVCLRLVTPPTAQVAVRRRDDTVVRFSAPDLKERKRASLGTVRPRKEDRWARLPKAVVALLVAEGVVTAGMDVTLQSDAPSECGLSLRSAFAVALLKAVSRSFATPLTPEKTIELLGRLGSHYLKLDAAAVGRLQQSGEMMLAASTGKVYACDLRNNSLSPYDWTAPGGYEIVLITAGVPQFADDMSIREIDEFQKEALGILRKRRGGASLRDYGLADLEEYRESLPDAARRAAFFILGENERVEEAANYINEGDMETLGGVLSASHGSLRENLDLSCPEIDWLVKRGLKVDGVIGMRIHGLAYGGAIVAILRTGVRENLMEAIEEYGRIFGFSPEIVTLVPDRAAAKGPTVRQLEG